MKAFESFDQLLEEVRAEKPKEGFSAIIGNPPYQTDNDGLAPTAVYHHFMEVAKVVTDRFASLVYPSRWVIAGQGAGLAEFRESELNSCNYVKIHDFSDSSSLFADVGIAGGVMFFLWDLRKTDRSVEYFYNEEVANREFGIEGVFVRDPKSNEIVKKINPIKTIDSMVSNYSPYGRAIRNEGHALENSVERSIDTTRVWYVPSRGRTLESVFVSNSLIIGSSAKYDVAASVTANGSSRGGLPRLDRIFIAPPGEIGAANFLKIGEFTEASAAEKCALYVKTDFVNFLLGIITPTQNCTSRNYALIPNVNFSTGEIFDKPGTFLDFSKRETLDDQLAAIYNLTEDERNLMTKDLKSWKDKTSVTADM